MVSLRDVEGIDQGRDVEVPGHTGHVLALGAEQGHQVVDGVDLVFLHEFFETLRVEDVELLGDGAAAQLFDEFVFQICGNYIIFAINMLEIRDKLGTDLSASSDNKNPFHIVIDNLKSICPQI